MMELWHFLQANDLNLCTCGFEFSIKGFLFCNFKSADGDACCYVTLKIIRIVKRP